MKKKMSLLCLCICICLSACTGELQEDNPVRDNQLSLEPSEENMDFLDKYQDFSMEESAGNGIEDDELYAAIKEIYDEIDFSGEFNPGDYAKYDLYKRQYKKMMDGEVKIKFKDPETDKEKYEYLYELGEFRNAIKNEAGGEPQEYYEKVCTYYFFDMDGDNNSELFITDNRRFTYIFKYEEESDQIVMWDEIISHHIFLYGTLKWALGGVLSGHGGMDALISLDSNGEPLFYVRFKTPYSRTPKSLEESECFVALPDNMEPDEWMKSQAVYDETDERYYFRVTLEQFDELTGEYYRMKESAYERIKEMTYTYEELFDSFVQ